MTTDIDTLATALYVTTDDLLKAFPEIAPPRPAVGAQVQLSDAELITLAVMQALRATPPSGAGCGTRIRICGTCSRTCRGSPGTTSARVPPRTWSPT